MTAEDALSQSAHASPLAAQSGTSGQVLSPDAATRKSTSDLAEKLKSSEGEEQPLEWHEVIELQAFSERKVWIEEKVKFLEKMPPIEVFAGLDAIRSSAEEVPGLPTRKELDQWLIEHDKIEKETEIFDSGELRKLKELTKAAAHRNLSPADTDLIELTLTTIYQLDKLLHLLRDRSDNLDLLGVRLTWEERRVASWTELRKLVADLQEFLDTRARWSPAVYEAMTMMEEQPLTASPTLRRRNSSASIASVASETSISPSFGLSREARFKLAELLSRDAAQFASRVSSLRHMKITAAGKALDKLIDNSRKPVPEELLDEQDRLEDKGINEMEEVGKFVMSVVMQWKKADEIYVETFKDKASAQMLLEEIETAKLNHPAARQDAAFLSRTNTVMQRLEMRSKPGSFSSVFPRPLHPLFSDQEAANDALVQLLSSELLSAIDYAKKAELSAKEYHSNFEAVRKVESVCKAAHDLSTQYTALIDRLETGTDTSGKDGNPPALDSELCLDPTQYLSYVALLPSCLQELEKVDEEAHNLLRTARVALLDLERPGVDPQFTADSSSVVDCLAQQRNAATKAREQAVIQVAALAEVRKVWSAMQSSFKDMEHVRSEAMEMMEREMWKQQTSQDAALLTPESPTSPLPPSTSSPAGFSLQLELLSSRLDRDLQSSLSALAPSLGPGLKTYLTECLASLTSTLELTRLATRLWDLTRKQAEAMNSMQAEVHELQTHIEDLGLRFDSKTHDLLAGVLAEADFAATQEALLLEVSKLQGTTQTLLDGLPLRIPFVSQKEAPSLYKGPAHRKRYSLSADFSLEAIRQGLSSGLPFDPAALDRAVRADSNTYSMLLAGSLKSLTQKAEHFRVAHIARAIDVAVASLVQSISHAGETVKVIQSAFKDACNAEPSLEHLAGLSEKIEDLSVRDIPPLSSACSSTNSLLRSLDVEADGLDQITREELCAVRRQGVQDAESRCEALKETVVVLRRHIADVRQMEVRRIAEETRRREEERRAVEARARAEQEKLETEALEQAERARLEAEAQAEAEKRAAEAQRRDEEERQREAERRLEEERRRQEEVRRLDEERRQHAEEIRRQVEEERIRQEEARQREAEDKKRLQREREEQARLQEEETRRQQERRKEEELRHEEEERKMVAQRRSKQHSPPSERASIETVRAEAYQRQRSSGQTGSSHEHEDVFGLRLAPSSGFPISKEETDLQSRIFSLRKRLRSIGINDVARPSSRGSPSLPDNGQADKLQKELSGVVAEVALLPPSCLGIPSIGTELRSLRSEIEASESLMQRIHQLAELSKSVLGCDHALSDLLEHIDSFPAPPLGILSSSHTSNPALPPEAQFMDRLSFTQCMVDEVKRRFAAVSDDSRAVSEHDRISQTWSELQSMGMDLVSGDKSRPPSAMKSGRSSRASVGPSHVRKKASYSQLSVASPGGKFLAPPARDPRRSSSGGSRPSQHSRSSSRMSVSSNRSVSGPVDTPTSRLFASTFASRQRTNSVSSTAPSTSTPVQVKRVFPATTRPRAQTGQQDRTATASPALSDASSLSHSRSSLNMSRSSMRSTWARAPRQSFPTVLRSPPLYPKAPVRKPYVPNPKNKLDVAVGDVVNKLPVSINIEVVADTWKDKSGKYWIGDQDPRLCFCRILRSQTVMVRVGGGWSELSKFIREHFAEAFRLLPESPPRAAAREEKWISSATLSQSMQVIEGDIPRPPRTPEPSPFIPSFALSTPSGRSPRSIKSSSPGSPMHALQFLRRADRESPSLRPETPSRAPRSSLSIPTTPARLPVWRP